MTLLAVFSAPKPFTDPHIAVIQRNAIRSWMLLPGTEVILVGDEAGLAQTALELGARHFPDVARNAEGTPLLSSIFEIARQNSASPLLAYVNADIVLMPDFVDAARKVGEQKRKFLIVGQRWDLDITAPLDFSEGWTTDMRQNAHGAGKLHRPVGSDYFVFPRGCFTDLPDFAVGRSGWDNWMIYKARKEGLPAIDASADVTIIHQNHDYSHLPGGQRHHRLQESKENVRLGGGPHVKQFRLYEASHRLVNGQVTRQPLSLQRLRNELYIAPYIYISSDSLRTYVSRMLNFLRLAERYSVPRRGRSAVER
jgi:hypothetical protein